MSSLQPTQPGSVCSKCGQCPFPLSDPVRLGCIKLEMRQKAARKLRRLYLKYNLPDKAEVGMTDTFVQCDGRLSLAVVNFSRPNTPIRKSSGLGSPKDTALAMLGRPGVGGWLFT